MNGVCNFRTLGLRLPAAKPHSFLRRRGGLFSTRAAAEGRSKGKVIVVSGPTGAGKSRLAMELAKRLNGEIVSADSVQVYHGLDVGSAKPSLIDRKEVPHHVLDLLHPAEEYSVGQFYEDARQATNNILEKGRVPIVAGGAGLYLRWFMYGKPDVPQASLETTSEAHSKLEDLQRYGDWDAAVELVVKEGDPKAKYLPANNWYRLRRSLEIIKSSGGAPPSAFQIPYDSFREPRDSSVTEESDDTNSSADTVKESKSKDLDYDFICFFLSNQRLDLYRLIDYRCEEMVSDCDGLLSEAKWLLDIGLLPNSNPATRAIGYRQAMEYMLRCRKDGGRSSPAEFFSFLSEFQKVSRNFAKRQMTWFRNEKIYHWLNASRPIEEVIAFISNAYHDQSGTIVVPDSLKMSRDLSSRRDIAELKAYRPENRLFKSRNDCLDVLDWIARTHEVKQSSTVP